MTLAELAVSYRGEAEAIRMRIRLVEELPTGSREEELRKLGRLKILTSMLRDTRELAGVCAHYYDRSHRISERYRL